MAFSGLNISFMSRTHAPSIAGIDIINEYFTANFLSNPQRTPTVSVVPDLEIPGKVAIPCAIPMITESLYLIFLGVFLPFGRLSTVNNRSAVIKRPIPGTISAGLSRLNSFLNTTPIIPVGIVEIITQTNFRRTNLFGVEVVGRHKRERNYNGIGVRHNRSA